ncbi:MAG: InlB B-repeat-containing protein [Bacilli bacterium]|nr:InlB B-repeat-containing protein [Bacilli bacterium]
MKKVFLRKILLVIFGISFILSSFNVGKILAAEPTFELSNAVIESKSDGVDASIESFSNNKLITDTTFHKVDDYVKYKLTIKNTSKTKYKLVLLDDSNTNDNVTYEYNYDKDEYILENDTMDVLLIVTYKKGITQINQRTQDQEVKILFYLEDEEGNTYEETITNNPKTNDNILIYIITAITSLILIVLIAFRKKLSKLFAFLLLIVPIAINALSPSLIIVLRNNTNLLDKMVVYSDVDGESQAVLVDYNTAYERPKDPEKTGYVFDNWYIGDQVYNFDEPLTDDINLTAKFNIINYNINYELDDGIVSDNPSTYNVETETFTLNNPTKEGYVFLGWSENDSSDLSTKVTINKGSTGDKTFKAHFEAGDATPYTVKHKYKKLDGTYDEEVENLVGVTDSEITVAIKHKYGFVDPTLKSLKITSDGQSYIEYEYEREEYELTLENSENIDSTFTSGKYLYETEISLMAKTLDNYNFVKWSNNETSKNIKFNITEDTTIGPIYQVKQYTVSFDGQGGSTPEDIIKDYNSSIGTLPTSEKENYIFDGWYTEATGGTKINSDTKVLGDVTYYAHWLKSIALATVTPTNIIINRGQSSKINVSNVDEEYTFKSNNIGVVTVDESGMVSSVGKGTTTITVKGTTSGKTRTVNVTVNALKFMVHFNSLGGTSVEDIEKEENTTLGNLPTTEKENYIFDGWYTEETGGTKINSDTEVVEEVTYYAHWLKSMALATVTPESITLEKPQTTTIAVTNVDEEYTFKSNNTGVATVDENGLVSSVGKGTTTITITGTTSGKIKTVNVTVNALKCAVSFDSQGGTSVDSIEKEENETIGTLPTSEKENYIFDGWYTSAEGGTKITENTMVTGSVTYYAHWLRSVALATVTPESITLTRGETATISVTDVDEEYTITSNKVGIATVENNVVTAVAKGSATLTVRGNVSNKTKTVAVTVNPIIYTISFDSQGGTEVEDIEREENTAIGTLPTTEKENYIFDGWYTALTGGKRIYSQTGVTEATTYYAHWLKSIALADITPTSISINNGQSAKINVSNVDESYTFTSNDEDVATVDENGIVSSVGMGTTTITIRGTVSNKIREVNVTVNAQKFVISFDSQGGTEVEDIEREENAAIGTLPTSEKENYIFDGWYTSAEGGTKITENTMVTGPVTYYAHWLRTVALATVTPESITLTKGETATISVTDVEEEYTITSNKIGIATVENNVVTAVAKGSATLTIRGTVSNKTKTVDVTVNPIMYTISFNSHGGTEVEDIQREENTAIGTLPTIEREDYIFDGWYTSETGGTKITSSTLAKGNVTYHAQWLKSVALATVSPQSITLTRGETTTISVTGVDEEYTLTSNNERIAIVEDNVVTAVAKGTTTISINGAVSNKTKAVNTTINPIMYTISFDSQGGTEVEDIEGEENTAIGALPTTEKENYIFAGWYTAPTGGTKIYNQTDVTGTTTYYAHWLKSVALATITPESISLIIGQTTTISVTGADEEYTITSNNEEVATVENNVVTAVAKGTTTLTVRGTVSNKTKTVNVTITTGAHTVTFDPRGGSSVEDIEVEDDAAIGTLPTSEKENYELIGWYTSANGGTKITSSTKITDDVTYYAHWNQIDLDLTKVFYIPGSCTFNGSATASQVGNITSDSPQGCVSTINPSGNDIDYTDVKYIDSQISLFSTDNFEKDFELGFTLNEFIRDDTVNTQSTIVNSKLENSTEKYPGFVIRRNTNKFELTERFGNDTYAAQFVYAAGMNIRVSRQDGVIFYSIDGGKWISLQSIKSYDKRFNLTTWFGAMSKETNMASTGEGSTADRYFKGNISNVYIKLETGSATKHTVTFDPKGGSAIFTSKQVKDGNKIFGLPTATRNNMELEGWYTDETYTTKVTEDTIINEDVTFVAKWKGLNAIARVDDTEFISLQDAIDSTRGSETKKVITILEDLTITEKLTIHSDNNIEFDLQNNTLTSTKVSIFENYGILTIKNGTLINNGAKPYYSINNKSTGVVYITGGTFRATKENAISNDGRMEISGGNIIGTADAAPINNNTDGILIVSGGSIVATSENKGQAIYNDGGTVTITDGAYLENNSTNRAALHNNVGTVNILGGTIIAKNYSAALNSDTMIIGDNSDPINITSPVLQGKTYGLEIASGKTVTVYDGIFKGITSAINDLSKVTHNTNVDFNTTNTETIGDNTYNVAYLEEQ